MYKEFLFEPLPPSCTYEPCDPDTIDDRDGIDESFEEDKDKLKLAAAVGGKVVGQTQLEKDQAIKIAKLEIELDKLKVAQSVPAHAPGFHPLPAGVIPPNVPMSRGPVGPPTTTKPQFVATPAGVSSSASNPFIGPNPVPSSLGGISLGTVPVSSSTMGHATSGNMNMSAGPTAGYSVSPAAYMAAANLQSQLGVTQPIMSGAWGQPQVQVQVQGQQSARRKLAFFELDTFIPQVPGPNHVYTIEEVVAASLALIEYRLSHNLTIGGYHAHLRFILERAASRVHKDSSPIEYDRFVRERAEVYGPSVMSYGDIEGINRYLGLGSLRPPSYSNPPQRRQASKSSNVCWRYNGLGRCRQNCGFRHVCDHCGDNHPRVDCRLPAPPSQPPTSQVGTGQVGGGVSSTSNNIRC